MNFNKFNDKKRHLSMYADTNNYQHSKKPSSPIPNQFFYPTIPQYPFTPYNQNINYQNIMQNCDYNYNNKRTIKKKKNFHYFNKYQNNEQVNSRESINDPWSHLYANYPNIQFI
ncbi:conserved Plasmodium protein, unknown function [Plasmodium relictum]|uniref:Uncharacterized protein n=1 Tax=Plasmodium relictum TaxID=85471 RepID=A0A1J1H4T1_PLARL|nr:conserved Plasmodium protein, unknown function [Plasmodium relictum]CRG98443.1 conserved Plasmodium protein, unknown function [Plasmodium relictum]